MRIVTILILLGILLAAAPGLSAENYVNWKGGFWLNVPDDWGKVDYKIVDRVLAAYDTSRAVFNYEAVFAPNSSQLFVSGPYMVVIHENTGDLTQRQSDSLLREIASSYASGVLEAPASERLADLTPGKPRLDMEDRSVSVLTELAYRLDNPTKLWLFMKLGGKGLVSLYIYCPDSLFKETKPVFENIVSSLSFDGLKEAAGTEKVTFTDVSGSGSNTGASAASEGQSNEENSETGSTLIYVIIGAVIVVGIIGFMIVARKKKNA